MERIKLNVRGLMHEKLIKSYASVLSYHRDKNERILFCDYSDFDIPLGYTFNSAKIINKQILFDTVARLKKVTQEHRRTFDLIPKGFKTICLFSFLNENYEELINYLPVVRDWYDSENILEFM